MDCEQLQRIFPNPPGYGKIAYHNRDHNDCMAGKGRPAIAEFTASSRHPVRDGLLYILCTSSNDTTSSQFSFTQLSQSSVSFRALPAIIAPN